MKDWKGTEVRVGDILYDPIDRDYTKVLRFHDDGIYFEAHSGSVLELVKKGRTTTGNFSIDEYPKWHIMKSLRKRERPIREKGRCPKGHLMWLEGKPTSINEDGKCKICGWKHGTKRPGEKANKS